VERENAPRFDERDVDAIEDGSGHERERGGEGEADDTGRPLAEPQAARVRATERLLMA
jgi:hypothetical protein